MMNLKCIIIDDEPLAIDLLKVYVEKTPSLDLVGTFDNALSAIKTLNDTDIDILFLDINMPQITGLAISFGTMMGGALVTESVFSYPGIGSLLFTAIRQTDYPLIQGCTLIITVAVLLANFLVDIAYGFIDPRIRAAQLGER